MKQEQREAVYALWDELSEFEASRSEQAVRHLMQSLCRITGAVNANWTGALRMNQDYGSDPLLGWRIGVKLELTPLSPDPKGESFVEIQRMWNDREIDPSFLLPIRKVGTFRTYSLRREMPQEWFDSEFFKGFFGSSGIYDGAFVGFPLNEDAESHFGFYFPRAITDEEIELLAYASRGIKWFHRKNMLSYGLTVAESALTPAERRVLDMLLTGRSEKQIAADMEISYHTVHQHVTTIFRKFGVKNRSGLMALWLGVSPSACGGQSWRKATATTSE